MDIISLEFVLSAITSVFIFYLLNHKYRIAYLAILSCGFIASFSYFLLIYILGYSIFNYFIGLKISNSKNKQMLFRFGVIVNISQLVLLKYASFAIDPFFQLFNSSIHVSAISKIIIPIGVSYFTLQGIGYLINIKMAWEKPENRFLDFLLYITFFPKFLSGPIERSNHFLPQLKVNQSFNEKQVEDGLRTALIGFFKKIVIANQLSPYLMSAYTDLNSANGVSLWIIFLLVPIYLYFDFSGYTDIAIGFARAFGINILPNFNRPFFSENVTTFWKRFHISLASWFGDYIFRQIVFKRRKWGVYASVYGVFITWVLFGIWHGAGWTFMLLGLLQAIAVIYEFFTKKWRYRLFSGWPEFVRIWFGRILTYLFYAVSLVFFFAPDLKTAFIYFSRLTDIGGPIQLGPISLIPISLLISIPVFLVLELIQNDFGDTFKKLEHFWYADKKRNRFLRWSVYCLMLTIIYVVFIGTKEHQFIYVNF